jgi:hypothetical protein
VFLVGLLFGCLVSANLFKLPEQHKFRVTVRPADGEYWRVSVSVPYFARTGTRLALRVVEVTTDASKACSGTETVGVIGFDAMLSTRDLKHQMGPYWTMAYTEQVGWTASATISIHDLRSHFQRSDDEFTVSGGSESATIVACNIGKKTSFAAVNFTTQDTRANVKFTIHADAPVITTTLDKTKLESQLSFATYTAYTGTDVMRTVPEITKFSMSRATIGATGACTVEKVVEQLSDSYIPGTLTKVTCHDVLHDNIGNMVCVQYWSVKIVCRSTAPAHIPDITFSSSALVGTAGDMLSKAAQITLEHTFTPSLARKSLATSIALNGRAAVKHSIRQTARSSYSSQEFVTYGDYTCITFPYPVAGTVIKTAYYVPCQRGVRDCVLDESIGILPVVTDGKIDHGFSKNAVGSLSYNASGALLCFSVLKDMRGTLKTEWKVSTAVVLPPAKAKMATPLRSRAVAMGPAVKAKSFGFYSFIKSVFKTVDGADTSSDSEDASSEPVTASLSTDCSGSVDASGECSITIDTEIIAACPDDETYGEYVGCTTAYLSATVYLITVGGVITGVLAFLAIGALVVSLVAV